jgi:NAD(P)H dehydrogenase (quinone)
MLSSRLKLDLRHKRVAETLPENVLTAMYAAPKAKYPVITPEELTKYDGFLFGKA